MEPIIFGIIGIVFIFIAFVLCEFNTPINQNSESYQIINMIGAGFLVYYSFLFKEPGIPFLILNAGWFVASFYKLIRIIYRR